MFVIANIPDIIPAPGKNFANDDNTLNPVPIPPNTAPNAVNSAANAVPNINPPAATFLVVFTKVLFSPPTDAAFNLTSKSFRYVTSLLGFIAPSLKNFGSVRLSKII